MKKNFLASLAVGELCFALLPTPAFADTEALFGDNSRWSLDLSTRVTRNTETRHDEFMHVIGADVHKVFSNNTSDIGTLTFQPYIVKLNNVNNPSFIFDDGNDTQLTWRIANFNYTALSQGKFNIRAGHFEIPFGLEYQVDTNGTLRQLTFADRGIKADWGFSVNGILPQYEYEVALTRGSGNEITSKDDPYIFSGRFGTPSNRNIVGGVSWFTGDVLGKEGVTKRQKIGLDASYYYYQWQFMAESSFGETAKNETINGFVEALWRSPQESVSAYTQLGYQRAEINHQVSSATNTTSYWLLGVQWIGMDEFDISAQYKHKIEDTPTIEIDPILSVQLRYRM